MQVSEILRVKGTTLYTTTPDTMLSDCVVTMADHDIGETVGLVAQPGGLRPLQATAAPFNAHGGHPHESQ